MGGSEASRAGWRSKRRRRNWIKGTMIALRGDRACPLCNGPVHRAAASWMHVHLGCQRCGLIHVAELPTAQDLAASYARVHLSDYQVRHKADWWPWIEHKHRTLDALGLPDPEQLPPGSRRALDLGCGEGHLLRVLSARGWRATGLEINAQLAHLGQRAGLQVTVASLEQWRPDERFRLITMAHLLEHLRQPLTALRRLHDWLAPDGMLMLETPLRPDFDNIDHLYCFSAAALELALRRSGFRPLAWFDYVDDNYRHLNLAALARRAADHSFSDRADPPSTTTASGRL